jgi:hypothetical protein
VPAIFDAVHAVRKAARAETDGHRDEALEHVETALRHVRVALEGYARVARDQSDRGAIATLAEYVYRPLRDRAAAMRKRLEVKGAAPASPRFSPTSLRVGPVIVHPMIPIARWPFPAPAIRGELE